jgi:hypothetical protein
MNQKYSINIIAPFNFHVVLVKKNDIKRCVKFWYKALIEDFFME